MKVVHKGYPGLKLMVKIECFWTKNQSYWRLFCVTRLCLAWKKYATTFVTIFDHFVMFSPGLIQFLDHIWHENPSKCDFLCFWTCLTDTFWQGQISGSVEQFPARCGAFVDPLEDFIVGKFHKNLSIKSWDRTLWKSSPWLDSAWNWWSKSSVFGPKIDLIYVYFVLDAFVWHGKSMPWLLWPFPNFLGRFYQVSYNFRSYLTRKSIKMWLSRFLTLFDGHVSTGTNLRIRRTIPRQIWGFCCHIGGLYCWQVS